MAKKKQELRKDLEELHKRKSYLLDENRTKAVAKRHAKGKPPTNPIFSNLKTTPTFAT